MCIVLCSSFFRGERSIKPKRVVYMKREHNNNTEEKKKEGMKGIFFLHFNESKKRLTCGLGQGHALLYTHKFMTFSSQHKYFFPFPENAKFKSWWNKAKFMRGQLRLMQFPFCSSMPFPFCLRSLFLQQTFKAWSNLVSNTTTADNGKEMCSSLTNWRLSGFLNINLCVASWESCHDS